MMGHPLTMAHGHANKPKINNNHNKTIQNISNLCSRGCSQATPLPSCSKKKKKWIRVTSQKSEDSVSRGALGHRQSRRHIPSHLYILRLSHSRKPPLLPFCPGHFSGALQLSHPHQSDIHNSSIMVMVFTRSCRTGLSQTFLNLDAMSDVSRTCNHLCHTFGGASQRRLGRR